MSDGGTACRHAGQGNYSELGELIQQNPDVIAFEDDSKYTPLMYASAKGNIKCVSVLIEANSNVNHKDTLGFTPLTLAVLNEHEDIIKVLLDAGANPLIQDATNLSAHDHAIVMGLTDIVEIFDKWEAKQRKLSTLRKKTAKKKPGKFRQWLSLRKSKKSAKKSNDDDEKSPQRSQSSSNLYVIMQNSYKTVTYGAYDDTQLEEYINNDDDDEEFERGGHYNFDDGQLFIFVSIIGEGQQTKARKVSIDRKACVMKTLQNDPSMAHLVVPVEYFNIKERFAYGGKTRAEDYELYVKAMGQKDPDPETLDKWFRWIDQTFMSWEVRKYKDRAYTLSPLFDVEEESDDPKRDLLRFGYFYYMLKCLEIAHCDVAPRNVLVTYEGPVLIDFGASVKFEEINLNALPNDVTPAYYLEDRGKIRENHDAKGFYYTGCKYFGIKPDSKIMEKLDKKNRYDFKKLFYA